MIPHGWLLTYAYALAQLRAQLTWSKSTLLKIVVGWGLHWDAETIAAVVRLVPALILRTTWGDPSYGAGSPLAGSRGRFDPAGVTAELRPWVAAWVRAHGSTRGLFIELGNELNVTLPGQQPLDKYVTRYELDRTITAVVEAFPGVPIISPALCLSGDGSKGEAEWLHVLGEARDASVPIPPLQRCQFLGVHVYGHTTLGQRGDGSWADTSGQERQALELAKHFAPRLPWMITEYGIHAPELGAIEKGRRYAAWLKSLPRIFPRVTIAGATAYHLCADEAIQPEYHGSRPLLEAYGAGVAS